MSKPAGFVPIQFHMSGKILLVIGFIGLGMYAISKFTGWYVLPSATLGISIAIILISLYLIFVVPREEDC